VGLWRLIGKCWKWKYCFVVSEVRRSVKNWRPCWWSPNHCPCPKWVGHEGNFIVMPYYNAWLLSFRAAECAPKQTLVCRKSGLWICFAWNQSRPVAGDCVDYPPFFCAQRFIFWHYAMLYRWQSLNVCFFFAHAALKRHKAVSFQPIFVNIVNDWHTALRPYFLAYDDSGFFSASRSVFTFTMALIKELITLPEYSVFTSPLSTPKPAWWWCINFVRMGIDMPNKINAVQS